MIEISQNKVLGRKIAPVFLSNGISSTLIIPIKMARVFGLDRPSNVILEEKEEGILIRPLILEDKINE